MNPELQLKLIDLFMRKRRWRTLVTSKAHPEAIELAWEQVSKVERELEANLHQLEDMHADLIAQMIVNKAVA